MIVLSDSKSAILVIKYTVRCLNLLPVFDAVVCEEDNFMGFM